MQKVEKEINEDPKHDCLAAKPLAIKKEASGNFERYEWHRTKRV
jgi:hypothetical protein